MPDGRSKRGACLLSEMAPLQIIAIVTENEVEKPLVIWENSLMHSSYAARPLRYKILVFCYQNCSDLLREKNVLVVERKKVEIRG